jgi:AraC-like DNA-binding protein
VLHHTKSKPNYQLRRYFPEPPLHDFIEQFWFVNWDLTSHLTHTQQNLPDPNFHLVISNTSSTVIGPVSKVYSYEMKGKNKLIGIKFKLGVLTNLLQNPLANYVDKEVPVDEAFGTQVPTLSGSDIQICTQLQHYLTPFLTPISEPQLTTQALINLIKHNKKIYTVAQLAEHANISTKTVQRYFNQYIGLTPKWLIRKYRLQHALHALETNTASILDIVEQLEYTDQSHLIRDFKELIGVTPTTYFNAKNTE